MSETMIPNPLDGQIFEQPPISDRAAAMHECADDPAKWANLIGREIAQLDRDLSPERMLTELENWLGIAIEQSVGIRTTKLPVVEEEKSNDGWNPTPEELANVMGSAPPPESTETDEERTARFAEAEKASREAEARDIQDSLSPKQKRALGELAAKAISFTDVVVLRSYLDILVELDEIKAMGAEEITAVDIFNESLVLAQEKTSVINEDILTRTKSLVLAAAASWGEKIEEKAEAEPISPTEVKIGVCAQHLSNEFDATLQALGKPLASDVFREEIERRRAAGTLNDAAIDWVYQETGKWVADALTQVQAEAAAEKEPVVAGGIDPEKLTPEEVAAMRTMLRDYSWVRDRVTN